MFLFCSVVFAVQEFLQDNNKAQPCFFANIVVCYVAETIFLKYYFSGISIKVIPQK